MRSSSLGPESAIVNGELIALAPAAAYTPYGYGQQTIGVPNVSPSIPPYVGGANSPLGIGAGGNVGGYGTAENNTLTTSVANQHPWNLRVSPVVWAVGGLVVSLMLLKAVHWRDTIIEGEERAHVGPAREEAEAGA